MPAAARKIRMLTKLRNDGAGSSDVLSAIEKVPRETFLPQMFHDRAYEDIALPIGHGQTISQPSVVAQMTQWLEPHPRFKVLEIGTGSGYQAAILAQLFRRVYTVERHRPLLEMAKQRFISLDLSDKISTRTGDGTKGWPEVAPFERIIVTAVAMGKEPPAALLQQLAVGGIMIIPMGADTAHQYLAKITRDETGYSLERGWDVRFVPLLSGDPDSRKAEPEDPLASLYKRLPKSEELL